MKISMNYRETRGVVEITLAEDKSDGTPNKSLSRNVCCTKDILDGVDDFGTYEEEYEYWTTATHAEIDSIVSHFLQEADLEMDDVDNREEMDSIIDRLKMCCDSRWSGTINDMMAFQEVVNPKD